VPDDPSAPLTEADLRLIVAEVYRDAEQHRRSLPTGFEADLQGAFARLAPAAVGDDLTALFDRAERLAFIDVDAPTGSAKASRTIVKRGLRKAMAWYLRHVANQVAALGGALVRADRAIAKRLVELEHAVPGIDDLSVAAASAVPVEPLDEAAVRAVVAAVGPAPPEVVVTSSDLGLLSALARAGRTVAGLEPNRSRMVTAMAAGHEIIPAAPVEYLGGRDPGTLAAVVLLGVVDSAAVGNLVRLLDGATRALSDSGTLVLLTWLPGAWRSANPVLADLSPGHPLDARTWIELLEARGWSGATEPVGEDRIVVRAVRS
jgi:hypothetical protein